MVWVCVGLYTGSSDNRKEVTSEDAAKKKPQLTREIIWIKVGLTSNGEEIAHAFSDHRSSAVER